MHRRPPRPRSWETQRSRAVRLRARPPPSASQRGSGQRPEVRRRVSRGTLRASVDPRSVPDHAHTCSLEREAWDRPDRPQNSRTPGTPLRSRGSLL
ncbi:hypothetical protein OH77DRAFT_384227 [Trametes cingulata]|nr:hypothetical protein OH77DRAFT_384227 [Trametes cingulata]